MGIRKKDGEEGARDVLFRTAAAARSELCVE
jgi:hypothetical protein